MAASWQASALAVAVLAAVTLWRGRLSPAWRYLLWSLVLVRLLLPLAPPARWSPYNLAEGLGERIASAEPATAAGAALPGPGPRRRRCRPIVAVGSSSRQPGRSARRRRRARHRRCLFLAITDPPKRWPALPFWPVAASIWLLGVIAMAARIGLSAWRLRRAARAWPEIADPRVLELLAGCRRRLGLRQTGPPLRGSGRDGSGRRRCLAAADRAARSGPERLSAAIVSRRSCSTSSPTSAVETSSSTG